MCNKKVVDEIDIIKISDIDDRGAKRAREKDYRAKWRCIVDAQEITNVPRAPVGGVDFMVSIISILSSGSRSGVGRQNGFP